MATVAEPTEGLRVFAPPPESPGSRESFAGPNVLARQQRMSALVPRDTCEMQLGTQLPPSVPPSNVGLQLPRCTGVNPRGGPVEPLAILSAARRNPGSFKRENGLVTLHKTELEGGWSLEARAGRSRELNVRGLVAGVRYVPAPGLEVAPIEVRVGKQRDMPGKVTVGARLAFTF